MSLPFSPTESQQEALRLDSGKLVIAGAGSGKTTVMAHRYVALLSEQGLHPRDIVATTFARKAAASLRDRISRLLLDRLHDDPRRAPVWRAHLDAMTEAHIQTMHSFCVRVLRAFPVETGVDPDVAVGESAALALQERIRRQLRQALAADDPTLERLVRALGTRPLEMAETLIERLIVHPPLARSVRAALADREAADRWLDAEMRRILDRLALTVTDKHVRSLLDTPGDHRPFLAALEDALVFADRLTTDATEPAMSLGFDEAEQRALELLESDHPASLAIRKRVRALLVDEFQDTSSTQWRLIQALLRDEHGRLDPGKAFLVGDEKQAIFGFRGANVTVVHRARALATESGGRLREVSLHDNFRTVEPLLERLNPVLHRLLNDPRADRLPYLARPQRLEAKRVDRPEDPEDGAFVVAPVPGNMGDVAAEIARQIRELVSGQSGQESRNPVPGQDMAGQAGHDHNNLRTGEPSSASPAASSDSVSGTGVSDLSSETHIYDYGDIAILIRGRSALPALELALQAAHVPYTVHAGRGFLSRQEVRDLVHLIHTFADPRDRMSLAAVLRSPFVGLPDTAVAVLFHHQPDPIAAWRATLDEQNPPALARHLDDHDRTTLRDAWHRWQHLQRTVNRRHPADWLADALDRTGARAAYAVGPNGEQRLANLDQFLDRIREGYNDGATTLRDLQRRIAREFDHGENDTDADISGGAGVMILTMHAAKGLEFPVVMLPLSASASGGSTPSGGNLLVDETHPLAALTHPSLQRAAERATPADRVTFHHALKTLFSKDEELAEERRLLYVAATRAQHRLVVLPQIATGVAAGAKAGSATLLWMHACGLEFDKDAVTITAPADAPFDHQPVTIQPEQARPPEPEERVPASRFHPIPADPDADPGLRLEAPPPPEILRLPLEGFAAWLAHPTPERARDLARMVGMDPATPERPGDGAGQAEQGSKPPGAGSAPLDETGSSHFPVESVDSAAAGETLRLAGIVLHEAVEHFGLDLDPATVESWLTGRLNPLPPLLQPLVHDRVRALLARVSAHPWPRDRGPVRHEWPVLLRLGPVLLRGRIDVAWPQGTPALAIDLKSNDVPADRIDTVVARHGYDHQVRLYALALSMAREGARAEGRLCFIPSGDERTFPVSAATQREYLERARQCWEWAVKPAAKT